MFFLIILATSSGFIKSIPSFRGIDFTPFKWGSLKTPFFGKIGIKNFELYNLGIESGALGGKLTGAGGGGHLLFYCEPSKQKNLIEKMQGQGLKQVQCKFYESGCKVLDLYDFTNP